MKEACAVKNCQSEKVAFGFPSEADRLKEWKRRIKEATGEDIRKAEKVCIKHFEEKYICRYEQTYDSNFQQNSAQQTKVCLSKEAVPTLFLDFTDESTNFESSEPSSDSGKPKKRGTAGLQNLQKARMKRLLRKERMKNAGRRPKTKSDSGTDRSSQAKLRRKELDPEKDYFLSNRQATAAEKLVIPLRLTHLMKQLHDGSALCKEPPISIKDSKNFPIFNIIRRIDGISNTNNPLEWSSQDASHFVKFVSPLKGVSKIFLAEDIDGEALLNLTASDLVKYLRIDAKTSEKLVETFSQLREEVIQRFVNT